MRRLCCYGTGGGSLFFVYLDEKGQAVGSPKPHYIRQWLKRSPKGRQLTAEGWKLHVISTIPQMVMPVERLDHEHVRPAHPNFSGPYRLVLNDCMSFDAENHSIRANGCFSVWFMQRDKEYQAFNWGLRSMVRFFLENEHVLVPDFQGPLPSAWHYEQREKLCR